MSDVFGVSGCAMIDAIINGQTDPAVLAALAKGSLKKKSQQLTEALQGHITEHHRFMLRLSKNAIDNFNTLMAEVSLRIDRYLADYEKEMSLLQTIPGVQLQTATAIVAEIGTHMEGFS